MKVSKIKALDKFSHGRLHMVAGDTDKIESDEARELEKAGLVEIVGEDEGEDLLGEGAKMEPITQNKMEKAPANKAGKK